MAGELRDREPRQPTKPQQQEQQQVRVLVVDDEPCLSEVVAHSLRKAGYEVTIAADGEEGVDVATRWLPDLIVSDFQMPGLTGIEMCVKLYRDPRTRSVPVIMLTARGHRLGPAELAGTAVCDMLAKPFSAKQLVGKVQEIAAQLRAGAPVLSLAAAAAMPRTGAA
jgi:two-component system phosphate regulon response regulator PhoB